MFLQRNRRPGSFALRLAVRATLTAAVAIVAATMVDSKAMPKLEGELKSMQAQPPAAQAWAGVFRGHLAYVPVPALMLGLAAIGLRPFRLVLAVAAMVTAAGAVLIVVGSLLAALAPMYRVPAELQA